ncbi:MAG TPA: hypothetical protein ENK00_02655 [Chromatiales bacterium]|nr:hypothetical protein [Chromatiales bacterium]
MNAPTLQFDTSDECILPNPLLRLIAYSTAGVYVGLFAAWAAGLLLETQLVVLLILYSIFAGLLSVRHISILRKPGKVLMLGVVYAIVATLLHQTIF